MPIKPGATRLPRVRRAFRAGGIGVGGHVRME